MTDDEPFSLRREPAPRQTTKPEPPQTPPAKQMSLFDAGRNDLPGQALMFPDIDTLPHKAVKGRLLASAGTIEGIQKQINTFWFSVKYTVNPETLQIEHPEKTVSGFRVVLIRNRYRFEATT